MIAVKIVDMDKLMFGVLVRLIVKKCLKVLGINLCLQIAKEKETK